jgi:hypothetical protein
MMRVVSPDETPRFVKLRTQWPPIVWLVIGIAIGFSFERVLFLF